MPALCVAAGARLPQHCLCVQGVEHPCDGPEPGRGVWRGHPETQLDDVLMNRLDYDAESSGPPSTALWCRRPWATPHHLRQGRPGRAPPALRPAAVSPLKPLAVPCPGTRQSLPSAACP